MAAYITKKWSLLRRDVFIHQLVCHSNQRIANDLLNNVRSLTISSRCCDKAEGDGRKGAKRPCNEVKIEFDKEVSVGIKRKFIYEKFAKFGVVRQLQLRKNYAVIKYKTDEMAERAVKGMQSYQFNDVSVTTRLVNMPEVMQLKPEGKKEAQEKGKSSEKSATPTESATIGSKISKSMKSVDGSPISTAKSLDHSPQKTFHSADYSATSTAESVDHSGTSTTESVDHSATSTTEPVDHSATSNAEPVDHSVTSTTEPVDHSATSTADSVDHSATSTTEPVDHSATSTTEPVDHSATSTTEPVDHSATSMTEPVDRSATSTAESMDHSATSNTKPIYHSSQSSAKPVKSSAMKTARPTGYSTRNDRSTRDTARSGNYSARDTGRSADPWNPSARSTSGQDSSRDRQRRPQSDKVFSSELESSKDSLERDLFQKPPLGLFTKEDVDRSERNEMEDHHYRSLWDKVDAEERSKQEKAYMRNGFDEMIQLTKEGKLWHFPIDNEQDLKENGVPFHKHVFLDHLLEEFPKKGPIRHFMHLVVTGLSKNPYLTVEQKEEHIQWYKNYFRTKEDVLVDLLGEAGKIEGDFVPEAKSQQEGSSV